MLYLIVQFSRRIVDYNKILRIAFCKLIQVNGLYSAKHVCTGQMDRLILKTFAPNLIIKKFPSTFYTRKSKTKQEKNLEIFIVRFKYFIQLVIGYLPVHKCIELEDTENSLACQYSKRVDIIVLTSNEYLDPRIFLIALVLSTDVIHFPLL